MTLNGCGRLRHRVAAPSGPVVAGVRPEHVEVTGADEEGIAARVVSVEPTGLDTLVVAESGGQNIASYLRERLSVRPGDRVSLRVAPEHVHLFDPRTTARYV